MPLLQDVQDKLDITARSIIGRRCRYWLDAKTRCFVGQFLPEAVAKRIDQFEEASVTDVWDIVSGHLRIEGYTKDESIRFWGDIQGAHDKAALLGHSNESVRAAVNLVFYKMENRHYK